MSYNGSGTFQINSAGQPVVTGTTITSTAFNALTADLATGLSTAITKDGQTATTARIPFALGINSTLTTDATSATTGSIITAGGISTQKALWVGTTSRHVGATQFDAAITYGGVTLSNSVTGTGSMALSAAPALTGNPTITNSSNAYNRLTFTNADAGTAAEAAFQLANGSTSAIFSHTSTGYTANTVYRQNATYLYGSGAGGLSLITGAAQPIYFAINSSEAARIDTSGNLLVGTTSTSGSSTTGKIIVGGIVKTVSGTTSVPANTATTLFTVAAGSYLVTAYSEATGYAVTGIVTGYTGGPAVVNLAQYPGAGSFFSISGSNLQVTFGVGTYNCTWSAIRFS